MELLQKAPTITAKIISTVAFFQIVSSFIVNPAIESAPDRETNRYAQAKAIHRHISNSAMIVVGTSQQIFTMAHNDIEKELEVGLRGGCVTLLGSSLDGRASDAEKLRGLSTVSSAVRDLLMEWFDGRRATPSNNGSLSLGDISWPCIFLYFCLFLDLFFFSKFIVATKSTIYKFIPPKAEGHSKNSIS